MPWYKRNHHRSGIHGRLIIKLVSSMLLLYMWYWNVWCKSSRHQSPYNQKELHVPPIIQEYHILIPRWEFLIYKWQQEAWSTVHITVIRRRVSTMRVHAHKVDCTRSLKGWIDCTCKKCVISSHRGQIQLHINSQPDTVSSYYKFFFNGNIIGILVNVFSCISKEDPLLLLAPYTRQIALF